MIFSGIDFSECLWYNTRVCLAENRCVIFIYKVHGEEL